MNKKYDGFSLETPENESGEDFIFETSKINENIIKILKGTRPWLTLSAIACLLSFLSSLSSSVFDYFFKPREDFIISGEIVGYLIITGLILNILYAIPSISLLRYSSSIKKAINSREMSDLEIALKRQKTLWFTVGILVLLPFAIMIIGIAAMFIFAGVEII